MYKARDVVRQKSFWAGRAAKSSLAPKAWCKVVGALEIELNTAVLDSTGKPPALVALGEMPRLPVDLIVGTD